MRFPRKRRLGAGLVAAGALALGLCLVGFEADAREGAAAKDSAGRVSAQLPRPIDPGARYLFYLHGRIIEAQGERPTSPAFGVYEYRQILDELAEGGFAVISEQRAPGTDVEEYAGQVVRQVGELLEAGVPPGAVCVVGFSKGAAIAQWVSSKLGNDAVSIVLLGSCGGPPDPRIRLHGRVLSVYEASDEISGPCGDLFAQAPGLEDACEIQISTGKRHGAFYIPREPWLRPVLDWCSGAKSEVPSP